MRWYVDWPLPFIWPEDEWSWLPVTHWRRST